MKNEKFEDAVRSLYEQAGEGLELSFRREDYCLSIYSDRNPNDWSVWWTVCVEIVNEKREKHHFFLFENAVAFAGAKLIALRDGAYNEK